MVGNEQGTVGGGQQQKDPGMPDSKNLPQDDSSQQRQTSGQGGGAKSGGAQAPNTKQIWK